MKALTTLPPQPQQHPTTPLRDWAPSGWQPHIWFYPSEIYGHYARATYGVDPANRRQSC
jgi:hypothetical protein